MKKKAVALGEDNYSKNRSIELYLIRLATGNWKFSYEYTQVSELDLNDLFEGEAFLKSGKLDAAELKLTRFLNMYPHHIRALASLATIHLENGNLQKSLYFASEAVNAGLSCLQSSDFLMGVCTLDGESAENQPFLKSLLIMGLIRMESGEAAMAAETLDMVIQLNRDDVFGARALAIEAHLSLGEPMKAYEICTRYSHPDEKCVDTLYGMPLVLLRLGRMKEAGLAMKKAVISNPKVAVQLIREYAVETPYVRRLMPPRRKSIAENYRKRMRKFWVETDGAIELLKKYILF